MSGARPNEGSSSSIKARAQHQRAPDRQHLLLAARQRAGLLPVAFAKAGEIAEDALDVGGDFRPVAARHGAELKIFLDGEAHEGAAAFRHVGDAEPHDVLGRLARDLAGRGSGSSPVVRTMPQTERSVVVLPAPLAPSSVVMPPSAIDRSSPCSTCVAP